MTAATEFYVLSLKWTRSPLLTWWGANDGGYTCCLADAGRYTAAQIAARPRYYNNGETTLAVPCDAVQPDAVTDRDVMRYKALAATVRATEAT